MKSFLNPKILGLIADNTNLMAEAKKAKKWKKVTAQEILLWIDPVPDYEEFWERVDNMGWIDRSEVAPDTDEPWEDEEEVDLWFQHVAPLVDSIRSTATSHCVPCPKIDIIDDDRMTMKKYKGPRFDEWDAPVIYNRRPRRRNDFFTEFELSHAWYRLFFYCLDAVLECSRLIYKDHPKMKKLVDDEYDFPLDCAWECILDGSGEGITATELRARVTVEKGEELPPLRFDTSVPHMPKFMDIAKECYLCKWELVNEHEGAPSETPRGKIECEDSM
ncbi:hypothetical protein EDC01DRAFT_778693 [Geopyxis carbonaria]|nr:hypothetical protein EDC01DRAFT_778693 [Geopyxis carbonaria]